MNLKRNLVILIVLIAGLLVGLFLVQQTQIFEPKAAETTIKFSGKNVDPPVKGQTVFSPKNGQPQIDVTLISPFDK